MAFQQAGLFEWRTVVKQRRAALELKGWAREAQRRALEMLALVGLADFADTTRGSCPAACSSASRSPGPWPPTLRCC